MRFGGHQTFHLRDSWLHKGLELLNQYDNGLDRKDAADLLGVGKNMSEALKYWMKACKLVEKNDKHDLTSFGQLIWNNDPYIELDGSLLLIHYLMATNSETATAWYWFFNKLGINEFDTDSLYIYLKNYVSSNSKRAPTENMLKREISCLIHTYKEPNYGVRSTPETENPSPLSRFGIITSDGEKIRKNEVNIRFIDPQVFVYLLNIYWKDLPGSPESMSFESIYSNENSPGRLLGLDEEGCLRLLEETQKNYPDKYLSYNRTGGYFIVTLNKRSSARAMMDYYKKYRKNLGVN